jgi:hypothetical protein
MFHNASTKVLGRTFQVNVYTVSSDFVGAVSRVSFSFPTEHWHSIRIVNVIPHRVDHLILLVKANNLHCIIVTST